MRCGLLVSVQYHTWVPHFVTSESSRSELAAPCTDSEAGPGA
jgi:hypothetical protein